MNLLDALDIDTLREARIERHIPQTAEPLEISR